MDNDSPKETDEAGQPGWQAAFEELLAEGPALRSVRHAFGRIDEGLKEAFQADPVAATDEILSFVAVCQVSLMLRNLAGLKWALEQSDDSTGSKDSPLVPEQAVPQAERLALQLRTFLDVLLSWAKIRHTMELGKGKQ